MTYSEESYEDLASPSGSPSQGVEARRPIQLSTASTQVRIPVPVAPYEAWIAAVVLRDEFHRASQNLWSDSEREVLESKDEQARDGEEDESESSSAQLQAKNKQRSLEARLVLTSKFLSFLAAKVEGSKKGSQTHEFKVLESVWVYFSKHFLGDDTDIHKLAATLDVDVRSAVLCAYYEAFVLLDAANAAVPAISTPKLLTVAEQGGVEIFALFGGQGSNEVSQRVSVKTGIRTKTFCAPRSTSTNCRPCTTHIDHSSVLFLRLPQRSLRLFQRKPARKDSAVFTYAD